MNTAARKRIISVIILLLVASGIFWIEKNKNKTPVGKNREEVPFLTAPEGFKVSVFADNLNKLSLNLPGPSNGPRMMTTFGNTVFVSLTEQGRVIALYDKNNDGFAETQKTVIDDLNKPHGLAFYQDWLYIAQEDRVIRVKDTNNDDIADKETLETILDLPSGGQHTTRTIKILSPSNSAEGEKPQLFISIGSSCNSCNETDARRATIQKCDINGKNCETFARGLRNSVGFIAQGDQIFATDNGRDFLGDDLPPDELNIIKEGGNYGWPTCYGKNMADADFIGDIKFIRAPCQSPFETPSTVNIPAHTAPLGLSFYSGSAFPEPYKDDLFVALHGSWNSAVPVGYKIIAIDPKTEKISDFITGWLELNENRETVNGRPVDIINYKNGLLISDDNAGAIYFVSYTGK